MAFSPSTHQLDELCAHWQSVDQSLRTLDTPSAHFALYLWQKVTIPLRIDTQRMWGLIGFNRYPDNQTMFTLMADFMQGLGGFLVAFCQETPHLSPVEASRAIKHGRRLDTMLKPLLDALVDQEAAPEPEWPKGGLSAEDIRAFQARRQHAQLPRRSTMVIRVGENRQLKERLDEATGKLHGFRVLQQCYPELLHGISHPEEWVGTTPGADDLPDGQFLNQLTQRALTCGIENLQANPGVGRSALAGVADSIEQAYATLSSLGYPQALGLPPLTMGLVGIDHRKISPTLGSWANRAKFLAVSSAKPDGSIILHEWAHAMDHLVHSLGEKLPSLQAGRDLGRLGQDLECAQTARQRIEALDPFRSLALSVAWCLQDRGNAQIKATVEREGEQASLVQRIVKAAQNEAIGGKSSRIRVCAKIIDDHLEPGAAPAKQDVLSEALQVSLEDRKLKTELLEALANGSPAWLVNSRWRDFSENRDEAYFFADNELFARAMETLTDTRSSDTMPQGTERDSVRKYIQGRLDWMMGLLHPKSAPHASKQAKPRP